MASRSRGSAGKYSKLYTTRRWRRIRAAQLAKDPLCAMCWKREKVVEANVVDHIEPHKGDMDKFWHGPLQSLCERCHNSDKRSIEHGGRSTGCDINGMPSDPLNGWQA